MEVWIGRDGERHGPYKEADVREWLRSGQVSPDDLGWYEGMADWAPLSSLFPQDQPSAPPAFSPPPAPPASAFDANGTPSASSVATTYDCAGFWKRVGAYILDALVLWIPNQILGSAFGVGKINDAYEQALRASNNDPQLVMQAMETYVHAMWPMAIAQLLIVWLYFAICESSAWQATLGKLALGMRVTGLDGERISFLRATGRYFAKFFSVLTFGFGFLMVAWTQRKQGLHDMLAQTLVLNGRAKDVATRTRRSEPGSGNGTFNA